MDDKCMFFIKVRTGSLIFGYVAAVISGLGVLSCTGFLMFVLVSGGLGPDIRIILLIQMLFVEFTMSFTCTVLLLFGITNNKPVLIKTYIIYEMIHLGLLLCVDIILLCTCLAVFGVVVFFGCGIYALLVYMTYLTYKGMISSGVVYNPQVNTNPAIITC